MTATSETNPKRKRGAPVVEASRRSGQLSHAALTSQNSFLPAFRQTSLARVSGWCGVLVGLLLLAAPLSADENIVTVAGNGAAANTGDAGAALKVGVGQPFGVEVGPDGALYICEVQNHRVLRLDRKTSQVTTVAGNGKQGYSGDGGPATAAQLNEPYEVRFDAAGNMFFVEMKNHLIRRVDAKTGVITTVAGTGKQGYGGDNGPATAATFNRPHSIALDDRGGMYIADIGNHRIRRVDLKTGVIKTIAGNGQRKLPVDGATAAGNAMAGPRALTFHQGVLWIALREGHSVWSLDTKTGRLKHVAGTGKKGFSGDGGPALAATFNGPKGIALSPGGNVVVVDTENQTIRKINMQTGRISTIAGRGPRHRGGQGDNGPATKAELDRPHGVCVDPQGTVYIGDTNNHRVRAVKNVDAGE